MPHLPLPPRLANPWPELAAYVNSLDLGTAEDHVHSHIPYGECQVLLWFSLCFPRAVAFCKTAWYHGMAWHGMA